MKRFARTLLLIALAALTVLGFTGCSALDGLGGTTEPEVTAPPMTAEPKIASPALLAVKERDLLSFLQNKNAVPLSTNFVMPEYITKAVLLTGGKAVLI